MSDPARRLPAKALVYPARTVAGYGHIWSLGRAGVPVVALQPRPCAAFRSRFVSEAHLVPDPAVSPDAFVGWLVEYGRRQAEQPVLCMAEDLYAFIVSANRERLEPLFRYPFVPAERMAVFFDKRAMHAAAEKAGLRVPPTLHSPLAEGEIARWPHYPAVVKPLVSRFRVEQGRLVAGPRFPDVFGGKALLARDRAELARIAGEVEAQGFAFCVQRLVPGGNPAIVNVKFVADRDGAIPACFVSRKLRQQPADFGTCCVAVAEYLPLVHEMAERFCRSTGYSGPGGMEFKLDPQTAEPWFIEVNPRLDFWIRMATLKGVNLPLQHYRLALGLPLARERQRDGGAAWIDLWGDLEGYRWRRARSGYEVSLRELLRPYLRFDEAVFSLADPLPGLSRLARMAAALLRPPLSVPPPPGPPAAAR